MDFFRLKPINNDTEYEVVSELFCYNCEKFVPEIVSQKEVPRRGGIFNVSAIVIPSCFKGKPITKIGKACNDRYNIFEVNIPDSVVHIDDKAFRCCYNLESFIVPPSVKTIGREAFYCCPELESIIISNGVERIEKQAFWECSRLRSVVIPDSVTFIGDKVFLDCKNLVSVTLPESLINIGKFIFKKCHKDLIITTGDKTETYEEWNKRIENTRPKGQETVVAGNHNSIFAGKTVAFTGRLELCARDAAKAIIRDLGGRTSDEIVSEVNLLIVGKNSGSKMEKARKQGVEIMTEAEFIKKIGDVPVPKPIKFIRSADYDYEWFEASVTRGKGKVTIYCEDEGDKELNDLAFNFARKLHNELAIWHERAKPLIAKFYDDDDDWLDKEQITKQCFLDGRRLEELKVNSSGEFEFIFHDADGALGGHWLVLRGTVQDGFDGQYDFE